MILASLAVCNLYEEFHPLFPLAFAEIKRIASESWVEDTFIIIENDIFIITSDNKPKGADAKLEFHKKYIDIQFVCEGEDAIGWKNLCDCKELLSPYNEEKDYGLYSDNSTTVINVPLNHFAIFFPDDAHAPLAGNKNCKKIIAKVLVQ